MKKLLFGPSGIPASTKDRNTVNGVKQIKKLGLGAMELAFVHSVNIKKEKAPAVQKTAKENKIILTSHAPYYINLSSLEKPKIKASINRILSAAKITNLCGGWSVCFHAGYYMKQDPKKVYSKIKKSIKEIVKTLKNEGNKIWIRPELSGKKSQFGGLQEIIDLSSEIEQVSPCVDFAHMHARNNGKFNTYQEFSSMLEKIEKDLGKTALNNMHIHISGINYTEKGERNHLNLKQSDMNFKDLVKSWKDFKLKGVVITESPNQEKDALLLQKLYQKT